MSDQKWFSVTFPESFMVQCRSSPVIFIAEVQRQAAELGLEIDVERIGIYEPEVLTSYPAQYRFAIPVKEKR